MRGLELVGGAFEDDVAVVEDVGAAGRARARRRRSARRSRWSGRPPRGFRRRRSRSRTMIGARPSNGSSSRRILRIADQRPRDRQHLLLAAGQIGAAARAALLAAAGTCRRCAAAARPASRSARRGSRFSSTFRLPKMRRSSGTSWMPRWAMACGLAPRRSLPSSLIVPDCAASRAHQRLQRGALAGAVAAEQRHDLVLLDPQRHVEQDVRVAVVAVDACRPRASSCRVDRRRDRRPARRRWP